VTGWPSYTPWHRVPFSSPCITRRATTGYSNPPPHAVDDNIPHEILENLSKTFKNKMARILMIYIAYDLLLVHVMSSKYCSLFIQSIHTKKCSANTCASYPVLVFYWFARLCLRAVGFGGSLCPTVSQRELTCWLPFPSCFLYNSDTMDSFGLDRDRWQVSF
jgi:hypothetical protein